ncbi:MAG: dihydrolipoamide acyltransferase [Erysipelotrichaceae bacterium]
MKEIIVGSTFKLSTMVDESNTAKKVGSGDIDVFGTPMMIALMEDAARRALAPFLEEEETSVGINVSITHDAATPLQMMVYATATISEVHKRIISFEISAEDEKGAIGRGTHQRAVVLKDKFIRRAEEKKLM